MKQPHNGAYGSSLAVALPERRRARSRLATRLAVFLVLAAVAPAAFALAEPPPVASFRVYRAIDSRLLGGYLGDAGTRLENTNAASAGGVLGYLHSEVVPSFARPPTDRRYNDIDAIAVFEVHVLNVGEARNFPSYHPASDVDLFGPFMAFNFGVAMPPHARQQIEHLGAYVGIQSQANHPRHAYPGDWYSFVGPCPLSAWRRDDVTGQPAKPSPCPTAIALDDMCPASGKPDGTPSCQYTYAYLGYVRLDDLVGITSKSRPLCQEGTIKRACVDYTDFHRNHGVEYAAGPNTLVDCAGKQVPESGLPFWRGRCDPKRANARIRALAKWSALVTPKSSAPGSKHDGH